MEHLEKRFPVNGKDYKLYEEIGDGVSATVYRALCVPLNEIVAIKVLDLERCNNDLDGIRREVQTMTLMNHPNLIRAHCSFTHGQSLWVVMPYMAGGSCLHIMKSAYPEGFEEPVIATVLRETLKALVYLHARGHIHRDVKAGNILIDSNGAVKLADFGVSACMFDGGDRQRPRNTFVGTPCWMAPEVMQQLHGYDFKADIWSFGITALELAHGHAPFSKYPPMKVLLMTLQNAPPGLDYERDKRFSKSFKEMVATCLVKDPKKRPTSEKLLKHPFFKHARTNEYVTSTILKGLPPLGDRFRILKAKEADLLLRSKDQYVDEHLSQQKYIRGISAWNFNLEDLKNQAALIQDDDGMVNVEDVDVSRSVKDKLNDVDSSTERPSPKRDLDAVLCEENGMTELQNLESSLASFPIKPLQALKGYFDVGDDDTETSPNGKVADLPNSEIQSTSQPSLVPMLDTLKNGGPNLGRTSSLPRHPEQKKFFSGSLLQNNATFPKRSGDLDREYPQSKNQPVRNFSGPLPYLRRKSINNFSSGDDASEGTVVQHKGRFKVTSAGLSPKDHTSSSLGTVCGSSNRPTSPRLSGALVLPALQSILQQNELQREEIMKLVKIVEQASGGNHIGSVESVIDGQLQISYSSSKEKELQSQVIHLQQSIGSMVEELQRLKTRNAQLEKEMNTLVKNEGNGSQG